jgi:putative NADH-flavin reductase
MRIAVIGATGRTGGLLAAELLRRGHTVTALVRTPQKLRQEIRDAIEVVPGASTDPEALDRLVAGADAVVSALGPTAKEGSLHTDTARALVPVMSKQGVKRFVGISGAGIDVPGDQKGPRDKVISFLIQKLGGAVVKDKPAEYAVYRDSDLDWTLVRPPRLVDGPVTGRVYSDEHRPGRSSSIRRADLAAFLADVVERDLYPCAAPFVSQG